ncbi:MAG: MFS transporter [Gammaproteobacteria bacterium]
MTSSDGVSRTGGTQPATEGRQPPSRAGTAAQVPAADGSDDGRREHATGFTGANASGLPRRPFPRTPWYHGWNVLGVGIFTVACTIGTVNFSFTFWVMEWMAAFGSSRAETLLALSVAHVVAGFLFPFTGHAMDRFSIRWLASAGIGCMAIAFLLISRVNALWQIMLVYGLFISAMDALAGPIVAQALAAKWFRRRRGMAIGLAALGTSVGGLLMPPLVAFLLVQFGWRSAHAILAVLALVLVIPAILAIVRNTPESAGIAPEPESRDSPGGHAGSPDPAWTTRTILREPNFWLIVLGFLPAMEMTTGVQTNLGPYTADLGIDTQSAAYLMSIWSMTMIAGKILFGVLADRIDHRVLYYVGILALALALTLLAGEPRYTTLVAIMAVLGFATGGQLPLAGAMIGRYFGPLAFGSVMGLFYLCIRPIAFSGPIGGWVRDTFDTYDYFWLGGLVVALLCSVPMYRFDAQCRR